MASQGILSGAGKFMFITDGLDQTVIAQELMFAPDLIDFTLEENLGTARKARKMTCTGPKVVAVSPGQEETTLKISVEAPDWAYLQIAEGEIAQNVAVTLPIYKQGTVNAAGEITDADIVTGNLTQIKAYNASFIGTNLTGTLLRVATTPASAKEFQPTAGKLTFDASMVGAAVTYAVPKALTALPSLGKAPSPVKIGSLAFYGHVCSDAFPNGLLIEIPKITRTGKPTWTLNSDVPALEIPFEALLAPGQRSLVNKYLMP